MTDAFKDREAGFEGKFVHDEELRFKIMNRRNKLLGLWAAGEMGLTGTAADDYARAVVQSDFEEAGHEDVFRKVHGDLVNAKTKVTERDIRIQMDQLLATAEDQVRSE